MEKNRARILDLIPGGRLLNYLKSAAGMSGMPMRLIDRDGSAILAAEGVDGTRGGKGCPCPDELWEKVAGADGGWPLELPCGEGNEKRRGDITGGSHAVIFIV